MYSVCQRYENNREKILEIMNLGFARVMLNLDKYDPSKSLEAWIKSVMINVAIDEFRRTRAYKETIQSTPEEDLLRLERADHDTDWNNDLVDAVNEKLKELPAVTRNVFNLYVIDGYKHKEIASMLNIPEGTSHWHYHSARGMLQEYLKKEFGIDPKKVAG